MKTSTIAVGFLLAVALPMLTALPRRVDRCDPAKCVLPNCRCSNAGTPGGLDKTETPQLVFLTFDEAVHKVNFDFYQEVLSNRKNPNGQPITATFYVTHDFTNYSMINELYRAGNEIGLHSLSGNPYQEYWQGLNQTGWKQELVDEKQTLVSFARIPASAIQGARAPQLKIGGDLMYSALRAGGLKYDCSRPTEQRGLWPYTNDYKTTQECQINTCPELSYPGFWTVPMVNWVTRNSDGSSHQCNMADHCVINGELPKTADQTFDLIKTNFERQYTTSKSPFGIFIRPGWVNGTGTPGEETEAIQQRREGYLRFLDYLDTLDDVYIVSIQRGLQWVQQPTPLNALNTFEPFQVKNLPNNCLATYGQRYTLPEPISTERMFYSCRSPPAMYPWVGNPLGNLI